MGAVNILSKIILCQEINMENNRGNILLEWKNTEISVRPKFSLVNFFGLDKFSFFILENPADMSNWFCEWLLPIRTRRYGPLCGPTSSSCGLQPRVFLPFRQKIDNYAVLTNLGHFWCPAVTLVTFGSNFSNFKENPKSP